MYSEGTLQRIQDGLKIETFPKDVLDAETTIGYFDRLSSDFRIGENTVEVVYFNHVSAFQFLNNERQQTVKCFKMDKKLHATVFVCGTELEFGIGRMLQAYHEIENPDHKVFVVRSVSELKAQY